MNHIMMTILQEYLCGVEPAWTMDIAARSAGQSIIRSRILHWGRSPGHPSFILGGESSDPAEQQETLVLKI